METKGVNGHQHEISEKRLAPGAFPCRLDMELCACGAKRWVDLHGRPASPWQFINFRRGREETESTAVTIGSTPISALDGLITCGSCGQPMFARRRPATARKPATPASRAPATDGTSVEHRGCTPAAQRPCPSARCCKRS